MLGNRFAAQQQINGIEARPAKKTFTGALRGTKPYVLKVGSNLIRLTYANMWKRTGEASQKTS